VAWLVKQKLIKIKNVIFFKVFSNNGYVVYSIHVICHNKNDLVQTFSFKNKIKGNL